MTEFTHKMHEHLEHDPEVTKHMQSFYVEFFDGCHAVLDIACGRGEFLELLKEKGINGIGVDLDQEFSEKAKDKEISIVYKDIFDYLKEAQAGRFDGIFISHFVEHLSYKEISTLFELCHKVLSTGGKLLVVVPNVGSIGIHLDWFYRDLSHEGFRHPQAIGFLLDLAGLRVVETGVNAKTPEPLLGDLKRQMLKMQEDLRDSQRKLDQPDVLLMGSIDSFQPREGVSSVKQLLLKLRWLIARYLVFPYLGELGDRVKQAFLNTGGHLRDVNSSLAELDKHVVSLIEKLDSSFEAYVFAEKKPTRSPSLEGRG